MNKEERRRVETQKRQRTRKFAKGVVVVLAAIVVIALGYIGMSA